MMALSVKWVTLCALIALCIPSTFAAYIEVLIVPTSNKAIQALQSSLEPGHDEPKDLLAGTGGYSSGGASSASVTYDFRHPLRISRIELVTDQQSSGQTVHRIETGISNVNTLVYEFIGNTNNDQTLSYTFPTNTVARMLRVHTVQAAPGGLSWKSIKVWGLAEQFVPTPPSTNFRITANAYDGVTYPDLLLRGAGTWVSGKTAVNTQVYVTYDFNQPTRVDRITVTWQLQQAATISYVLYGGNSPETMSSVFFNGIQTAYITDGQVSVFDFPSGTQQRLFRVAVTHSAGNIVAFKAISFHTAKVNPELLFYPSTWGATTLLFQSNVQTVIVPPTATSANIQAYSGGGGCTNLTGVGGGGAYMAGTLWTIQNVQFYTGGLGSSETEAGGWGNGQFDGGSGGSRRNATVSGGGGGGGATFIKINGELVAVVGAGGGAGANVYQSGAGGNGGHGGLISTNGMPVNVSGTPGKYETSPIGGVGGGGGQYTGNTNGMQGQAYGGGGGGGGYHAGRGGGQINTQYWAGGGGGGGGASSLLLPQHLTASFANLVLGPMPGAIQILWEFATTNLMWVNYPLPNALTVGQSPITMSVIAGNNENFAASNLQVLFTIVGSAAQFTDGTRSCIVATSSALGGMAISCPFQAVAAGSFIIYAQTPTSANGGYLHLSHTIPANNP